MALIQPFQGNKPIIEIGNPDKLYGTGPSQEYARKMADELLKRKPPENMRHWTQGVAHMLDTLAGIQYQNIANAKTSENADASSDINGTGTSNNNGVTTNSIPPQAKATLDAMAPPEAQTPTPTPDGMSVGNMPKEFMGAYTPPYAETPAAPDKQSLKESSKGTWNKRINLSPDGTPASVRYNNPGAAWTRPQDEKYGVEGYGVIGGGNRIGKFPTVTHGLAANMDLLASPAYQGMTLGAATAKWRGGNPGSNLTPRFKMEDGTEIGPNTKLTPELLNNKEFMTKVFGHYAEHEAGRGKSKVSPDEMNTAFDMFKAGGADAYNKALEEQKAQASNNIVPPMAQNPALAMAPEELKSPDALYSGGGDINTGRMGLGMGNNLPPQDQQERQFIQMTQANVAQPLNTVTDVPGNPSMPAPQARQGMTPQQLRAMIRNNPDKAGEYVDQYIKSNAPYEQTPNNNNLITPQQGQKPAQYTFQPSPTGPALAGQPMRQQIGPDGQMHLIPSATMLSNGISGATNQDPWKAMFDLNTKSGEVNAAGTMTGQKATNAQDIANTYIKKGAEAQDKIRDLDTIMGINHGYGNLLASGKYHGLETSIKQSVQRLLGMTDQELNVLPAEELKAKMLAKLSTEGDAALTGRGSNLRLSMIEQANPNMANSIKGSNLISQVVKGQAEIDHQFAKELEKMPPERRMNIVTERDKFMAEHPLKVTLPGVGDTYIGKFNTPEEARTRVPKGAHFVAPNGKIFVNEPRENK